MLAMITVAGGYLIRSNTFFHTYDRRRQFKILNVIISQF